jgi:hypothetical protein
VTIGNLAFSDFYENNDIYINNGFSEAYNRNGKAAGTYTRPNTNSRTWTKQ